MNAILNLDFLLARSQFGEVNVFQLLLRKTREQITKIIFGTGLLGNTLGVFFLYNTSNESITSFISTMKLYANTQNTK